MKKKSKASPSSRSTSKRGGKSKAPKATGTAQVVKAIQSVKKEVTTVTRSLVNTVTNELGLTGDSEGSRKIRYAIVGVGHIAQTAVLPAFEHAANSELAAFVSGDAKKLKELGKRYGVKRLVSYDGFEELCRSGDIDAVYLATPNDRHVEFTEIAAKAGVHVLCEKPLAVTPDDCRRMVKACEKGGVKLMTAYRLHFDPTNLEAIEIVKSGKIGDPRVFNSVFSYVVQDQNIRTNPEDQGGGPLFDLGVYCINAARYLFRAEPLEVFATVSNRPKERKPNIPGYHDTWTVIMRFPEDRIANFVVSFNMGVKGFYEVVGLKGDLYVENAYEYHGDATHYLTVDENTQEKTFRMHDQFAPELIYFSDCIIHDRKVEPSGEEGLRDVLIIDACRKAAKTGKWAKVVQLEPKSQRPTLRQEMRIRPVKEPETVDAQAPSKN